MSNKSVNIGLDLLYNPHKVKQTNPVEKSTNTYRQEVDQFVKMMVRKYPEQKNSLDMLINPSNYIQKIDISSQID